MRIVPTGDSHGSSLLVAMLCLAAPGSLLPSPVDERLGCTQSGAVTDDAARNIPGLSLGGRWWDAPGVGLLGHRVPLRSAPSAPSRVGVCIVVKST